MGVALLHCTTMSRYTGPRGQHLPHTSLRGHPPPAFAPPYESLCNGDCVSCRTTLCICDWWLSALPPQKILIVFGSNNALHFAWKRGTKQRRPQEHKRPKRRDQRTWKEETSMEANTGFHGCFRAPLQDTRDESTPVSQTTRSSLQLTESLWALWQHNRWGSKQCCDNP